MRLCFEIGRFNVLARGALALLVSAWPLSSSAQVAQPAGPLNLYAPAETPEDDLQLSRATDFGHLRMGAQLQVDYANNPLVWEDALGSSDSERYAVVRHHMVSTLGLSLGLWDRAVVYAGLPATVWMAGDGAEALAPLGLAKADPAGLGEAYFGGRVRIWGERDDVVALAAQLTLRLPTGAYGEQVYRSLESASAEPELIAEVRPHPRGRIVANLGSHVRADDPSGPTNFAYGSDLSLGLGYALRAWAASSEPDTHLDLHAQLHGNTQLGHFLAREHSPLELILGCKFFHASGLIAGLAAGPGVSRGVGSPDVRAVGMVGYAVPQAPDGDEGGRR